MKGSLNGIEEKAKGWRYFEAGVASCTIKMHLGGGEVALTEVHPE